MRMVALAPLAFLAGCAATVPSSPASHATAPHDGSEWHSCADGSECREGWACMSGACEPCFDDDGTPTRCTNGNDG